MSEKEEDDPIVGPVHQFFTNPAFGNSPILPMGLDEVLRQIGPKPIDYKMPDFDFSRSPHVRAANAAEDTAEATAEMRTQIEAMVHLTARNVQMAEAARSDAERTERFARAMTWASTVIAIASLIVATIALVVSL